MRISTRGEYGVRAMFDLALHYGEGPISLKVVAQRQGISEHYLEQLMASLRRAGLISSVRGAQGGYMLAAPPAEIRMSDILRTLEGPIAPMDCVEADHNGCDQIDRCPTQLLWRRLRDSMEEVLDQTTLQTLCDEGERLDHDEAEASAYQL